jgi:hypothetical protein
MTVKIDKNFKNILGKKTIFFFLKKMGQLCEKKMCEKNGLILGPIPKIS